MKFLRKCSSIGIEMLYGRLVMRIVGFFGSFVMCSVLVLMIVSWLVLILCFVVVCGRCVVSWWLILIVVIVVLVFRIVKVSELSFGLILIMCLLGCMCVVCMILWMVFVLVMKFWLSFFVGVMLSLVVRWWILVVLSRVMVICLFLFILDWFFVLVVFSSFFWCFFLVNLLCFVVWVVIFVGCLCYCG